MWKLLTDPTIVALLVAGAGWLVSKLRGEKRQGKAQDIATKLAESAALMAQVVLASGPDEHPGVIIAKLQAVARDRVRALGADPARWGVAVDRLVAEAMELWYRRHPGTPPPPPILNKPAPASGQTLPRAAVKR